MKKLEREKLAKAKAQAKVKAQEAAAKKKTRGVVGEFGYGEKTLNHKFCAAISKKAMTMKQVKAAKWNDKGQSFYTCFSELRAKGIGKIDNDKKMSLVMKKSSSKKKK